MHEIRCPHCKARNRRPRCGGCQAEIIEPRIVNLARTLHEHRKHSAAVLVIALLTLAFWRPWEIYYPANLLECKEQAARTAKSKQAMWILVDACSQRFQTQ